MGGDLGPRVVIAAAVKAVAAHPELELFLVGDKSQIQRLLHLPKEADTTRLSIIHAPDVVEMDDDPLSVLRHKKKSSMWLSLACVREGRADACVSGGNTGALVAISKYLLKTFPGVERPAICKAMPVEHNLTYMLDLGANLICTPAQLQQFALMGSVLAKASGCEMPRVGLLNVGIEETKGPDLLKQSQRILAADRRVNYIGFVEGDSIYNGVADVIVCDGFSGNIALKSSEGVARLVAKKIENSFKQHWYFKLLGLLMRPLLAQWREELNPAAHNGASLLGLQKTVIKSHGSSGSEGFYAALRVAMVQVEQKIPERIQEKLLALN